MDSAFIVYKMSLMTIITPSAYGTSTKIVIPATFYDEAGNAYSQLDITSPTKTRITRTRRVGKVVISDKRSNKENTNAIAADISKLLNKDYTLVIEDSQGKGLKELIKLNKNKTLSPYDIYLLDEYGMAAKDFGTCIIVPPIPSSMNLKKGKVQVVAVATDGTLEKPEMTQSST